MMFKVRIALGFLTLSLLVSVSVAFGQIGELIGDWKNIDPNTRGLTRVLITESGADVVVHAWGRCHPADCDWTPVNVYGLTVKDNLVSTAHAISALSRTSFSETLIIAHLTAPDHLQIETMTRFIDGNGRTSYTNVGTFTRTQTSP
jgi:hypothetical protein